MDDGSLWTFLLLQILSPMFPVINRQTPSCCSSMQRAATIKPAQKDSFKHLIEDF